MACNGATRKALIKVAVRRGDIFQHGKLLNWSKQWGDHIPAIGSAAAFWTDFGPHLMTGRVNKKQRPARLWKLPDDKHEVRLKITPILNPDALIKDTDGVVAVDDDGDDDDTDDDDDDDEDYHSFNCILYYIYIKIILLSQVFLLQHVFASIPMEMVMLKPGVPYFCEGAELSTMEVLPRSSGVPTKCR